MSELSNSALSLLVQGKRNDALRLARQAAREQPADWHARYVFGHCLQHSDDLAGAIDELAEANRLSPKNPTALLALGITRQLSGAYAGAIDVLGEALEIDPEFVPAMNSLAMTQKLMGQFAVADQNYVLALDTLSRRIVKGWRNSADNPRYPHGESRNHLWAHYACGAALWLAVEADMDSIATPTGDMATRDAQTGFLKGWYWEDCSGEGGKKVRLFYPNFFNTFRAQLAKEGTYRHLIGNRGTVLEKLGKTREAEAHLQEAVDFS
jgi:tetratricopeptide (TPR) repeat protein